MKNIYFTTPIYYASGNPHLGHAYTTILTDCFVKYYDLLGYDTRFTTGTDEHGLKIERIAQKNNIKTEELVDTLTKRFQDAWENLRIEYDDFLRTTEKRHKEVVIKIWEELDRAGDIYLSSYEGLYCVDCEQFYTPSELLEDDICPIHQRKVETMAEESYFFRMSKYQDALIKHIEDHPKFVQPATRRNEVLGFLKNNELRDLSISRTGFKWGIPVPGNNKHVMYVWIDALANYISSLGGIGSENYNKYWNHTIHLIGKDILRFHTVYWPCMLFSLGLELPKSIIVHGWWTIANKKISKSDPATKVNPIELAKDVGVDGLRYYLLKELILGKDGDIEWSQFISSINTGLANNIGNLVNRSVSMVNKYLNGQVNNSLKTLQEHDCEVENGAHEMVKKVKKEMDDFNPSAALNAVIEYCDILNGYLDKTLPWQLAKDKANQDRINEIFAYLTEGIRWVANMLYPFVPDVSKAIKKQMNFNDLFLVPEAFILNDKNVTEVPEIIYKRISKDEEIELVKKWINPEKISEEAKI